MYKFFFLSFLLLLSGCAVKQLQNNQLASSLQTQTPQWVLEKLQATEPVKRDRVQFRLNLGYLQFITGDFPSAIVTLSLAKEEMEALSGTSISENVEAGTINETLRRYSGYPTDKVMVHTILAFSYLFTDQIYDARVEALQADLIIEKSAGISGPLASNRLLAGIIYELLYEYDNALISYRDAAEIMEKRGVPLPSGLKQSLLRMSFKLGAKDQYLAYQAKFHESALNQLGENQLFVFYFDGLINHKIQKSIMVPDLTINQQLIRISMPAYPSLDKPINPLTIIQRHDSVVSEPVEDLDLLAKEELDDQYASMLLLTTTRAITKYQLVKRAKKVDPFL